MKPPRALSRSADGSWLGGVCAGLARERGLGAIRAAFLAAALIGGLGILVYLSCWLIVPIEGEAEEEAGSGWIVRLAQACAICLGVLVLAACGAAATLFGFGWIVAGLAAAVLLGVLLSWPRLGPAWALLPIAALTVPSLAVAASGLRLTPEVANLTLSPRALSPSSRVVYRAGLGTMLVDLRNTRLPGTGTLTVHIYGGVRRTIVALPAHRCVHIALDYHADPFVAQLAAQLSGETPFSGIEVFGDVSDQGSALRQFAQGTGQGPWLRIEFSSAGGSLYVRDYPDAIDPDLEPNWPGYRVYPEARPDITGVPRRAARRLIAAWRVRHAYEVRSMYLVDSLMPGPCAEVGTR